MAYFQYVVFTNYMLILVWPIEHTLVDTSDPSEQQLRHLPSCDEGPMPVVEADLDRRDELLEC